MNALKDWVMKKIGLSKIPWISFIFFFSMMFIFSLSFEHHKWLTNTGLLLVIPVFGWGSGYILSKTRWKGFWCLLYSVFLFVLIASQRIGNVLPLFQGLSLMDWINQLNWQFYLFTDMLRGWLAQFIMHEEINDPNLYSAFLMMELWLPVSWFVWVYKRKSKLWLSILPMLVLIVQNVYATDASIILLYFVLIVVLVYAAITEYFLKHRQWIEKGMDYPESLWQDWLVTVFLILMISLVAAHYAPKIATPEGWQDIQEWMEEVREASDRDGEVAGTNAVNAGGTAVNSPSTVVHIVSEPDVSRVGEAMPDQNQLVMWVRVADPTPRNWRTAVYTTYTGAGWIEAEYGSPLDSYAYEDMKQKLGLKYITQTFSLNGDYDGQLFATGDPVQVNKNQVHMLPVYPDGSVILRGKVTRYEVVSQVPNVSEEHLRTSSGIVPQWIENTYLQLPDSLPQRVRDLSHELVLDQETQLDRVITIQNYLRELAPYDLTTPMPAENQDVADYFLFEAPSGFCTYYATSMVVLLRELGIPARLVTGYASGTYILEQGLFQVWGTQAHAWVEVYFPQYGWITFEPTPNREVPTYARSISNINLPIMMSPQDAKRSLFWLRVGTVILALLVVAIVGFMIFHLWRRRRMISRHSKHPYIRLYYKLRYRLQTFGYDILPDQTVWEFWHTVEKRLRVYPKVYAALLLATQGVEKAIYSPYGIDLDDIKALKFAIRNAWWEWVRMGWGHFKNKILVLLSSIRRGSIQKI